jgi:hypothetical protein
VLVRHALAPKAEAEAEVVGGMVAAEVVGMVAEVVGLVEEVEVVGADTKIPVSYKLSSL